MIAWLLRLSPLATTAQLALLLVAIACFVAGLGSMVRGAESSAFLPVGLLAALLGWGLSQNRVKGWQACGSLGLIGGLLLWGRTAQFGGPLFRMVRLMPDYLLQAYFYQHGGSVPEATALRAAVVSLASQSVAVWTRLQAWLASQGMGANLNDPVARLLLWSLLLWGLAAWAGWAAGRNRVLAGLIPALGVLALITDTTGSHVTELWLMLGSTLALLGLAHFEANLRRWVAIGLDYAELVVTNTLVAVVALTMALAALGWALPQISLQDLLESLRRRNPTNQTAQSLGLEVTPVANAPLSPFAALRAPTLPNQHLLGSGPELSKQVVFTVRTGELSPLPVSSLPIAVPRHYWRSNTFDGYTGRGWVSSPAGTIKYPAGQALSDVPPGYQVLTQNFELRGGETGSLYWTGNLYRSNTPFEAAWRTAPGQKIPPRVDPLRGADLLGALITAQSYQVESLVQPISLARLRAAGRNYPAFIQARYLALPPELPERVYALARELTSTAATPYEEAKAIETYLRANYPYNLDVPVPPVKADVADYFLFDLKTGYCDYYATAMAVLARAVGLPSRLVMGYASGTYNYPTAEYLVTAAEAHSWVEIYFPGSGWVEFEPTANQPELARSGQLNEAPQDETPPARPWDTFLRTVTRLPSWGGWVVLSLVGVLGLFLLFFLLESWLLGFTRPAFALRWMLRSVYRQAARLLDAPVPGQTASEFAADLQATFERPDPRLELLTGAYLKSLFSPHPPDKVEVRQAIRAWRGLRWKLFWVKRAKK